MLCLPSVVDYNVFRFVFWFHSLYVDTIVLGICVHSEVT